MFNTFLQQFSWLGYALFFLLGVVVTRCLYQYLSPSQNTQVNQDYFKGLNFLLNEQPDKAIEVFIKALEVDSETVELHLALGGLFRRKGQVDRATRIHQNLIARTTLTQEQRLQAIYELAQDYDKAGLLDRAENLYIELKDSATYRRQAIEGLSGIYQKEKEWAKAIDITRQHKRAERHKYARQVSHYWCELAEQAIASNSYEEARKHLRSAVNEDRSAARPILLRGELNYQKGAYREAISLWQSLSTSHAVLAELVVDKMIRCYQHLDDQSGLIRYLQELSSAPKDAKAFQFWHQTLVDEFGEAAAIQRILEHVRAEGLSGPVVHYLCQAIEQSNIDESQQQQLLKDVLTRAKSRNIEYTCLGCGFDTKAMHWHCPNCGDWDSFS